MHVAALGVRLNRVAYAWKYPEQEYVAFRALADLMVDNRLYNPNPNPNPYPNPYPTAYPTAYPTSVPNPNNPDPNQPRP